MDHVVGFATEVHDVIVRENLGVGSHVRVDLAPGGCMRAAPLVKVKATFPVKNTGWYRRRLLAYGLFDCDFPFDSYEWSCSQHMAMHDYDTQRGTVLVTR